MIYFNTIILWQWEGNFLIPTTIGITTYVKITLTWKQKQFWVLKLSSNSHREFIARSPDFVVVEIIKGPSIIVNVKTSMQNILF